MLWYRLLQVGPSSLQVRLVPGFPHTNHRPEHHPMSQPLSCHTLYGSRNEEVAFAWSSQRSHIVLTILAVD